MGHVLIRKSYKDWLSGGRTPLPTQIVSNEEFYPMPQTADQRRVKQRIFDRNLARLYDVDVNALRKQFPGDSVSALKAAYEAEGPEPSNTAYGRVAG
jgi:hypothetical protein